MTDLYIWRHGQAENQSMTGRDADRRLVPKGRKEVQDVAYRVLSNNAQVQAIYSSPYVRARETAEILERVFKPAQGLEYWEELESGAEAPFVTEKLARLKPLPASVILVGHMPDLSRIANYFLGKSSDGISFEAGGVAKISLEKPAFAGGKLTWLLMPSELAR